MKFYEKRIARYITMETKITISSNIDVPLLYQLVVVSLWLILFVPFLDCVGQWLLVFLNTAFFHGLSFDILCTSNSLWMTGWKKKWQR